MISLMRDLHTSWLQGLNAWAAHCLGSWRIKGQCALAIFTLHFSLPNKTEVCHVCILLSLYNGLKRELPGVVRDPDLPPQESFLSSPINKCSEIAPSHLGGSANSTAKTLSAQQLALNSLAQTVLNNRVALGYLLTGHAR